MTQDANNDSMAKLIVLLLLVAGISWCNPCSIGKEKKPAKAENQAEKCLSSWDGSHTGLVEATKALMNDPGSFEHVETRYSFVPGDTKTFLTMTFRGKNVYGGTITQTVTATIGSNCELISGPTGF